MGDGLRKLEIIPDYFEASTSGADSDQQGHLSTPTSAVDSQHREDSFTSTSGVYSTPRLAHTAEPSTESSNSLGRHCAWTRRTLGKPAHIMKLFSLRGLPFTGGGAEEKVEISAVELESLRSELADLEEKEAHVKAQLEHLDEILRWARLSGYLYIRSRWAALPGEPPPIDDCEVDDWIPRFVVLQGPCLFFFLLSTDYATQWPKAKWLIELFAPLIYGEVGVYISTLDPTLSWITQDLSPQDSTLLTDVTEVGPLPDIEREGEDTRHCFFIVTKYGLRFECSSISEIQVDTWLRVLQKDCKTGPEKITPVDEDSNNKPQNCA